MPVELEAILRRLAKHPQIFMAVISGRALRDVHALVNIDGVTFAGNHGLEIEYPDGSRHDFELPGEIQRNYKAMVDELKQSVEKHGAWVEDKRVSLTYHYRDTPKQLKDELKHLAIDICQRHGFRPNQAHEAIEAKPPVDWNKGEAALHILKTKFGDDWAQEVRVVFAGDDTTDEDAMRVSPIDYQLTASILNINIFSGTSGLGPLIPHCCRCTDSNLCGFPSAQAGSHDGSAQMDIHSLCLLKVLAN